jgi:tetratricopeptide (TPR) repeat protein
MHPFEQAKNLFLAGLERFQAGDLLQAEARFRQSLALVPDRVSIMTNLAATLIRLRQLDEARALSVRALDLDPGCAESWVNLGQIDLAQCRFAEALADFDQALGISPKYVEAWLNKGVALNRLKRLDEALACHEQLLRAHANYAEAWSNRGNTLHELKRDSEALACYQRALALKPDLVEAWSSQGVALNTLKRHEEALVCHDRALALDRGYDLAWGNKGVTLHDLQRDQEALQCYETALRLNRNNYQAWSDQGVVLYELGRYDEALACYAHALEICADDANARWNQALVHLLRGEFRSGWRLYEARRQTGTHDIPQYPGIAPLLDLAQCAGRQILVVAEQGLGDVIQFSRYLPLLAARGARVSLAAPAALQTLLGAMPCCALLPPGAPPSGMDFQVPLLSLPCLFATDETSIPPPNPWLKPSLAQSERWRAWLPPARAGLKIGLVCSGNPQHQNDHKRSMALAWFAPLLPLGQWLVLQPQLRPDDQDFAREHPQICCPCAQLQDFSDTAALIEQLDLVISVDTSVAHLAGSLGKPVYLLLPWAPEWRWQLARQDSPWYPSARLLRQPAPGDWGGVLRELAAALAEHAGTSGAAAAEPG